MSKVDEMLWKMWLDEHGEEDFDEHNTKIKQALYKDLLELIGEDETPEIPVNDYHWRIRNELRQELRTKLKDYFGETND